MKTVLIIESDAALRAPMEEELRRGGYEVVGVGHGAAGLAAAKEYLPDVVLCAERMPGMDGYHVARLLRHDPDAGLPRLVLLVAGGASAFLQGIGIDGVLRVPAAPERLLAAVAAQFEDGPSSPVSAVPPVPRLPLAGETPVRPPAEILDDLAEVTGDLLGMVEKFLKFTQVKAVLERRRSQAPKGGPRLAPGLVHSNQVGSLARVAADAQGRAADLNCHLEKGFLPLEMEELAVVVGELVENACRYSQPGAPVDVFYFRQGEGSEVMVRDYGSGMSPAEVESLRAPVSAPVGETAPPPRLGLTMVRMITESRGGRFLVHSVPDVGTTVRVLLPDLPPADRSSGDRTGRLSDLGVPPFEEGGGDPF